MTYLWLLILSGLFSCDKTPWSSQLIEERVYSEFPVSEGREFITCNTEKLSSQEVDMGAVTDHFLTHSQEAESALEMENGFWIPSLK